MSDIVIEKIFNKQDQEIEKLKTRLDAKDLLIAELKKKIVDLEQEAYYQENRANYWRITRAEKAQPVITPTPEEPEEEELDILSQWLIKTGRGFLAAKNKPK